MAARKPKKSKTAPTPPTLTEAAIAAAINLAVRTDFSLFVAVIRKA